MDAFVKGPINTPKLLQRTELCYDNSTMDKFRFLILLLGSKKAFSCEFRTGLLALTGSEKELIEIRINCLGTSGYATKKLPVKTNTVLRICFNECQFEPFGRYQGTR